MKTLDEVIFEAPYSPTPWEADALHYLKAFRDAKNALDAERERSIEAYCQWQDAKEKLEAQTSQMMWVDKHFQISDNPPLTWDELKQMSGKPVWFEDKSSPYITVTSLMLIHYFYVTSTGVEGIFAHDFTGGTAQIINKDYGEGKTWQAYRKEKE